MARYTLNLGEICQQVTGLDFNKLTGMAFDRIDDIANASIPLLFSDRYEVLDEADDKNELFRKIIEHYWEYEICTFTPSDFILRLNRKLNEIMPYYNQRYLSTKMAFPVFEDVDYTDVGTDNAKNNTVDKSTGKTTNSGTDTVTSQESGTTTLTNEHEDSKEYKSSFSEEMAQHNDIANMVPKRTDWAYNNDTPQGSISGIEEEDYLTSYGKTTSELARRGVKHGDTGKTDMNGNSYNHDTDFVDAEGGSITSNQVHTASKTDGTEDTEGGYKNTTEHGKGDLTTTEHGHVIDTTGDKTSDFTHEGDYSKKIKGKANSGKSYSQMMLEYRDTIINIYEEIIYELRELFFLIY